jgi:hypothetical protein
MAEERTAAGDGQQGAKDLSVDVLLDLASAAFLSLCVLVETIGLQLDAWSLVHVMVSDSWCLLTQLLTYFIARRSKSQRNMYQSGGAGCEGSNTSWGSKYY